MEQIYCYKMCRQITPQMFMFIALQGKSQFKIKVIQISLWFVVCSHVKNFVVIGHFANQHFRNISGIQGF